MTLDSDPATRLDDLASRLEQLPVDRRAAARAMLEDLDSNDTPPKSGAEHLARDPDLATVTLADLEAAYGVSRKTLLRRIEDGTLEAVKLGAGYRVTVAAVRRWLDAEKVRKGTGTDG